MYYLGLLMLGWLVVGFLYWIYVIYVDQDWERMQKEAKEHKHINKENQEVYEIIMKSKTNFLVFCVLVGAYLAAGELLFEIKFWFNEFILLFKKEKR